MERENYITVLCYGDSNTYGYDPGDGLRYASDVRWPGRLQKILGNGYHIIEEGCNGRTASVTPKDEPWKDGRTSLKTILNSHKPIDWFVLMLGSNDMKKQFGREAAPGLPALEERLAAGITEILMTTVSFLKEKQGFAPRVLLISPPAIREGIETSPFAHSFSAEAAPASTRLPKIYRFIAESLLNRGLVDCAFLDSQEIIQASELDCLHLMPEAHATLAGAVAEKLKK